MLQIFFKRSLFITGLIFSAFLSGSAVAMAASTLEPEAPPNVEVATALTQREAAVAAREKEVASREEKLAALEKELEKKLADLLARQNELQQKLSELQGTKDKQFRDMVKIYTTMSASKSAPLLNQMEDANVARILRAMKSDIVAKIIPKLEQGKAVRVSKMLGMLD